MTASRVSLRRHAAVSACLLVGVLALPAWAQSEQTVLIGHAGPLTGGAAHWGKDNDNGARLAVEDLNRQNLLIGGRKIKFVLQSEDDQADPKQAMVVANKLADMGVKGILGHFNSGAAIPASAVYSRAGLPDVSTATNPSFTKQGYDNVFRILASDDDVGMAIANYTVKELKATKIAVIDDRTAYGQGAAEVFARGVKALGGTIVAQEYGSDKATDFMAILTSIKARQPEVVFYGGMDAQGGLIARQMKQLGITAKLLGTDGLCTNEVARISGGAVDGLLYCTRGGKEVEKTTRGAEFEQRYKARFGVDVLTYAPYLYDAMMALAAGMREANSVEPAAYLPAMRKVKFDGVTGAIAFDAKGNLQKPDFTVFTYKDGKRVRVAGS
ncbi:MULTISPECIES: branched-chain amino acid ABC transporter substrate-binding protein [Comamonadaceae]|jgi:branched-chain amino acid transport system substrate-binding protein|uniref:branched-chain amino acid ABC transporter substrate-binding protein n=1 Tax=Variovorax sp. TaxID=1871043 RepID=UPI00122846A3|nr:branched-chain amino acid ABC transporter substrate-binding protein [Variovorax sp.]TAJ57599.1 MAG: branched-chain amino acid ABC transporter substrate-binding protein [Variovorax sp.]